MKRREGRGGGMGRRGFGRSRERRGRGKKKKGRRKIHRPHVLRFYESEGNRFRERKGAALIALPARSRGLGTRSFFLPPPPPSRFLFPTAYFVLIPGRVFSPNSIFRPAPTEANVSNVGQMGDGNQFSRFVRAALIKCLIRN